MSEILDTFYAMVEKGPLGWWAFLAGMVVSWGVMLRLRNWQCAVLSVQARQFIGHFTGFLAAVLVTWVVWPTKYGAIVGIAVGLFSPWSWELALLVIEWKWPKAAEKLRMPL